MKYKGFTREFVNFINDYKIDKIKKLINGDSASKNGKKKKGIKGIVSDALGLKSSKELNDVYKNIFLNVNLLSVNSAIKQTVIEESTLFETQSAAEQWEQELVTFNKSWEKTQAKNDYKSQSLKNKIVKDVKKSLEEKSENTNQIDEIIKKIKDRAFDQIWLNLNLESFLDSIKSTLTEEQIKVIEDIKQEWINELDAINKKYDYANWLDEASSNAINVSFSTHIAKLTHSRIKGSSSIYFEQLDENPIYLATSSLPDKVIDVSQTDNKFAPVGKLLNLKYDGSLLADKLSKSDISDFKIFSKNEAQAKQWIEGFQNAFKDKAPTSHSLSKQIFFPLAHNEYHLINPLASSSLDHSIFKIIENNKYDSSKYEIRKQKRNGKFHHEKEVKYPDIAVLKVTSGDKTSKAHMNVSPLNVARVGKRYLFPSESPQWRTRLKPPTNQESLFYGDFNRRAWESAHYLQSYLLDLQAQKSNKRIRDNVKKSVNRIIDILFNYVVEIQNMTEQAGWSETTEKLKKSHQLWLDPYRSDDAFQQMRKRGDWQDDVCRDFGSWLNQKLRHKKMSFEKMEAKTWAKMLKKRLREFERDLEAIQ